VSFQVIVYLKMCCPTPMLWSSVVLSYTQGRKPPMRSLSKTSIVVRVVVMMSVLFRPFLHILKTSPALFVWKRSRVYVTACRAHYTQYDAVASGGSSAVAARYAWSKIHRAQLSTLGCVGTLTKIASVPSVSTGVNSAHLVLLRGRFRYLQSGGFS